jgi:hypothetical protein
MESAAQAALSGRSPRPAARRPFFECRKMNLRGKRRRETGGSTLFAVLEIFAGGGKNVRIVWRLRFSLYFWS